MRFEKIPLDCENPRHEQHFKKFLKKYPTASLNAEFNIIDVDHQTWISDLEYEDKNTAKSCQMWSIQVDIKRIFSPCWNEQPAPADRCSCQWKTRF
jgi:hypothetical protein